VPANLRLRRAHAARSQLHQGLVQPGQRIGDWEVQSVSPRDRDSNVWVVVACTQCGFRKRARVDNLRISENRCQWLVTDESRHVGRPPSRNGQP
jgi:hypothetical protein